MNIDFNARPGFSIYVIFLMLSGIALLALISPRFGRTWTGRRIANLIFGIGYFAYGFYLAFIFSGGSYVIFFYAFVLPIILGVKTLRQRQAPRPVGADQYPPAPLYPDAQNSGTQYRNAQ